MALQKTILAEKNPLNIEVKDAYIKVTAVSVDNYNQCSLIVKFFKDKATSKDNSKEAIITKNYNFNYDKATLKNVFAVAYEFLKTEEEYSDSVDV